MKTSNGEELTYELETDVVEEGVIIDSVAYGGMHILITPKVRHKIDVVSNRLTTQYLLITLLNSA